MIENRRNTPAAARNLLNSIKALFKWGLENAKVDKDVARDIRPIRYRTEGHRMWTDDEIAEFEKHHPIGSQARLAMALLLYTACRREDVVRLGPQHVSKGRLRYTQAKNENRNPVKIDIPVEQALSEAISACTSHHMTFLVTAQNKPFTAEGFGNKFRQWCNEAGLTRCSSRWASKEYGLATG